MKKTFISSIVALVALFVFASGTAFAQNQQVTLPLAGLTPESPFYFFDKFGETLREFFTFNPEGKARLQITFAAERVSEVKTMLEKIEIAFVRIETHSTRVANILKELGGAYPASPIFSPNGRFLSLERVYGAADAHSDVYQDILIYDLQANLTLGVATQGDTNRLLGFNAASDKLFIWSTFDGHNHSWSFKYDLREVEIATLAARRLLEGGPVHNASTGHLQPPVPRIVFHTWQAEDINLSIVPVPRDIYVADVNPYRQERIVTGGRASSPRFSPDGRRIVYLQDFLAKSMGLDVFVSGSDGKNPLRLTVSGLPKLSPQWSPDSRRIAFIQIEGESRHALYAMQADGKGLRHIVP